MNIDKYFDLDFLNLVANDAKLLQDLCDEDYGFIFKRLKESNIFPDKKIIQQINFHMATVFLFENYPITNEDYIRYSSHFKDSSRIFKKSYQNNNISKDAIIEILFNESKGFSTPGFLLTKDDFIKYEESLVQYKLSYIKNKYVVDSFLSLEEDGVKELPLSIFTNYPVFYNSSSHYLFDNPSHLENFKYCIEYEKKDCDFTPFMEYVKRVNDISILDYFSFAEQNEDNLKKIYFIFKERDENFTINDMFPYLCKEAKFKIIENDYTGDFNPQILVDIYLNDENKLREDFGWDYKNTLENLNLPSVLKHYLSVTDALKSKDNLGKKKDSKADLKNLIDLLKDKEKIKFIDLSKIDYAPYYFDDLFNDLAYGKNTDIIKKVVKIYYNELLKRSDISINYIPPSLIDLINENTDPSLNKFLVLSFYSDDFKNKIINGVNDLPIELHSDLLLFIYKKTIPLDSPLFKADCLLKVKEMKGIPYLNQNHLKMLNEETILAFLSNGALIDDEYWNPVLKSFNPDFSFSNWQSEYISKNHKLKDGGPIFMELIEVITEKYKGKDIMFGKDMKINKFLPKLFAVCAEKIEYINNNKDIYIEMEKKDFDYFVNNIENKVIKINIIFNKLDEIEQDKIIKLINPNSLLEASVFTDLTGKKDILNSYVISQLKREENQRELDFSPDIIGKECINNLIKKDFWSTQDTQLKENIFIFAIQNFDDDNIYNVLNLIDWNNPQDDLEKKLKDYTIKNHADKILFSNLKLKFMWQYNMEDLYNMFQCLDDNSNWNFKRSYSTKFQDYLEKAITNSSKDMFWNVLDKAKEQSPAIYSMLIHPLAISNKMEGGSGFLSEEFHIFKKNYFLQNPDKQFKKGLDGKNEEIFLSPYLYIYDFIDLNTIVKGINSIRQSFSKKITNNSNFFKEDDNNEMFSYLTDMSNYCPINNNKLYLSKGRVQDLVNNLLEMDTANINIILNFRRLIESYGENNLQEMVIEKMQDIREINKFILKELSYTYDEKINKKIRFYSKQDNNFNFNFYKNLLESFAKEKPENALFLSHLATHYNTCNLNLKKVNSLEGSFQFSETIVSFPFGENIHNFAKDFYNSYTNCKKIEASINKVEKSDYAISDTVFKL